ncbi:MAG: metalloregulator ArsR/SmtB family transcription factor [Firmicutes bacterium]|nr:metalloregulator ArsR/SmtB family transcription factor [Bacillota bacterium]
MPTRGGEGADRLKRAVEMLKALADETRLEIVSMLAREEMCVCELMERFNMTQPAVSYHLRTLRQAGLLDQRREGRWIFYSVNRKALAELSAMLADRVFTPAESKAPCRKVHPTAKCVPGESRRPEKAFGV